MARYYPVALDLAHRRCLVVGGGAEALAKTQGLLEAGAEVHVVAPSPAPGFAALAGEPRLTISRRHYQAADLVGVVLAFACDDDQDTNEALAQDARRTGVLLNVVDQPALCDFIMPAVLRQGSLTIAITTDGKSPALASHLREQLADWLGPAYGEFLDLLGALRPVVKSSGLDRSQRAALFARLVRSPALERLRAGDQAGAHAALSLILKEYDIPWPSDRSSSSAPAPAPLTSLPYEDSRRSGGQTSSYTTA